MNVRIEYPAEFIAGVYWDSVVLFNVYTVKCEMVTGTKDNIEQNIALERLKYILFHQMQNSVFIDSRDRTQIKRLEAAGIRAIPVPQQPVDQIIGMMLYSKLDAVMEGRIIMHQLKLSSDLGENVVYSQNEHETLGPFHERGWWNSPDPACSDSKINAKVVSINNAPGWQHLDLHWSMSQEDHKNNSTVVAFRKDEEK